MDQIFGVIERITFQNEKNGFTVARLKQPRKKELTTLVGPLPGLRAGESVRCLGAWKNDPTHGLQFQVSEVHIETPNDVVGIQKYLESGMVKGIGPKYAAKIVEVYGKKTLEIIDRYPDALLEVDGIGPKRVETIKRCWCEQKSIRQVMLFLQRYGVSPAYAQKIYKKYGEEAEERLKANPYTLASEITGIGFKMADRIAGEMGFPKDGTQRLDSGIEYVLGELAGQGHVCMPLEPFLEEASTLLESDLTAVRARLGPLANGERIALDTIDDQPHIWGKTLYIAEKGIATQMDRLQKGTCKLRSVDTQRAVAWAEKQLNMSLAANQKEAVESALREKVLIITGGPGTGKSTITKAILAISSKLTRKILLAAPTGRAAKRMSEITRRAAHTIHALLQYDFTNGGFKHNRDNPLDCDVLIVDEASMIDTRLMFSLLKAIPDHARLLIVGDIHQLPSVGPGNVLRDLIDSQTLPTTHLTEIFRQAKGSKIITNAHKINQGDFPDLVSEYNDDFFFLKAEEPQEVLHKIIELVTTRLPKRLPLNPIESIQVLAPMKRGLMGIENLNLALQAALNPQTEGLFSSGTRFSIGDKVMQTRNNYTKEVYNGDIGLIQEVDLEGQELLVNFDGHIVTYTSHELHELLLAYAISIHKSQGSEFPCVVIPIHPSHFTMLHRNLLYTAITRGKRLVVLVGTGKAIGMATSNDDVKTRHTALKYFLQKNLYLC